jgi:hypothetical protein
VAVYVIRSLLVYVCCTDADSDQCNIHTLTRALHVQPHHRINRTEVFLLIILTTVTLVSSINALPDDGDYTETCWSCFNVSFNVNFKTVFKTVQLCISW